MDRYRFYYRKKNKMFFFKKPTPWITVKKRFDLSSYEEAVALADGMRRRYPNLEFRFENLSLLGKLAEPMRKLGRSTEPDPVDWDKELKKLTGK